MLKEIKLRLDGRWIGKIEIVGDAYQLLEAKMKEGHCHKNFQVSGALRADENGEPRLSELELISVKAVAGRTDDDAHRFGSDEN